MKTNERDALMLNPCAELVALRQGGVLRAMATLAPVRGQGLRTAVVARAAEPELVALLEGLGAEEAERAARLPGLLEQLHGAGRQRLEALGLLVAPRARPRPVQFRCDVQDDDAPEVRPAIAGATGRLDEELVVNPSLHVFDGVPATAAWHARARCTVDGELLARPPIQPFAEMAAWARVEHAEAALPSLLSLPGSSEALLARALVPGAPPPRMSTEQLRALTNAGILVDPREHDAARARHAEATRAASEHLARHQHAHLRGLIHPVQLRGLVRYFDQLIDEGHVGLDTARPGGHHLALDEPIARRVHLQLAPWVSRLVGAAVRPGRSTLVACTVSEEPVVLRERTVVLHINLRNGGARERTLLVGEDERPVVLDDGDALLLQAGVLLQRREPWRSGTRKLGMRLAFQLAVPRA